MMYANCLSLSCLYGGCSCARPTFESAHLCKTHQSLAVTICHCNCIPSRYTPCSIYTHTRHCTGNSKVVGWEYAWIVQREKSCSSSNEVQSSVRLSVHQVLQDGSAAMQHCCAGRWCHRPCSWYPAAQRMPKCQRYHVCRPDRQRDHQSGCWWPLDALHSRYAFVAVACCVDRIGKD